MILDPELEALAKCADALKDLDNEVRIRVIQYLINKYKLGSESSPSVVGVQNGHGFHAEAGADTVASAQNNPSHSSTATLPAASSHAEYPALRQVLLKQLPATEAEWILVYAYYSSGFGSKEFRRSDLVAKLDETNRRTANRSKGMTNAINAAIKNDWITALNDDEFLMAPAGTQFAISILGRTSASKPRKSVKRNGKGSEKDE
ncbi:MAG: hypothetical protein EOO60_07505 [Hymenobacter sp.]|nr:MAG: hypothetical protein EOO60_07505 [Hymenobacter sp.]